MKTRTITAAVLAAATALAGCERTGTAGVSNDESQNVIQRSQQQNERQNSRSQEQSETVSIPGDRLIRKAARELLSAAMQEPSDTFDYAVFADDLTLDKPRLNAFAESARAVLADCANAPKASPNVESWGTETVADRCARITLTAQAIEVTRWGAQGWPIAFTFPPPEDLPQKENAFARRHAATVVFADAVSSFLVEDAPRGLPKDRLVSALAVKIREFALTANFDKAITKAARFSNAKQVVRTSTQDAQYPVEYRIGPLTFGIDPQGSHLVKDGSDWYGGGKIAGQDWTLSVTRQQSQARTGESGSMTISTNTGNAGNNVNVGAGN